MEAKDIQNFRERNYVRYLNWNRRRSEERVSNSITNEIHGRLVRSWDIFSDIMKAVLR